MQELNPAQQLMRRLGVPYSQFREPCVDNRQRHPTKIGPGRIHGQNHVHGFKEKPAKGAPKGFIQRINKDKNHRRSMIAEAGGIRQFKKYLRRMEQMRRNLMPRKVN